MIISGECNITDSLQNKWELVLKKRAIKERIRKKTEERKAALFMDKLGEAGNEQVEVIRPADEDNLLEWRFVDAPN